MTGESAIIAAAVSSAFSVATLIITRIKCYFKRGEEGCEGCRCGCLDKPIIDDNNDIDAHEFTLGDTPIILIGKITRKIKCIVINIWHLNRYGVRPMLKV